MLHCHCVFKLLKIKTFHWGEKVIVQESGVGGKCSETKGQGVKGHRAGPGVKGQGSDKEGQTVQGQED